MSRPEHISPPELYYNEKEAAKYNSSSRIVKVQQELSNRAIELLNLPQDQEAFILDVGCGSGLSGVALEEHGHAWVGVDISKDMLEIASERDSSGDVFLQDMGGGLPFRPGVFDGCISISAVQWLCYSDKKEHTARKRLTRFFTSLFTCLKAGSRAVLQLYPETPEQMEEISGTAMRCGFSGGLVVDFPNSAKAKKFYLCLFAGYLQQQQVPQGLGAGATANEISYEGRGRTQRPRRVKGREQVKAKDWVMAKKERYRKQGKKVKSDSKFTGRKRPGKF
uniref:Methyltransferase type 11 domain-containing protein n=1 Tax=Hyaloperonospora arabidopsidis (strain Emoy2) TaxID=559515 RepID=M4BEL1_HYAAE